LTECNVDYDLKIFKRGKDQLADPELKKIHPLGKSPVISIDVPGQEKPLVIAESAFITEYLAEHFGKHLVPEHWQEGKEGQVVSARCLSCDATVMAATVGIRERPGLFTVSESADSTHLRNSEHDTNRNSSVAKPKSTSVTVTSCTTPRAA